jgi:hypothetical protein
MLLQENQKARAGRVAQVVDCLPSKSEVLSSNPRTTRKIKIKIKKLKD